jgi:hypothetical protein
VTVLDYRLRVLVVAFTAEFRRRVNAREKTMPVVRLSRVLLGLLLMLGLAGTMVGCFGPSPPSASPAALAEAGKAIKAEQRRSHQEERKELKEQIAAKNASRHKFRGR